MSVFPDSTTHSVQHSITYSQLLRQHEAAEKVWHQTDAMVAEIVVLVAYT
jgi:hypothetical protein